MTQCEKVLRHLRRNSGIPVVSEIVAGKNRFGETTHYAKYRLEDGDGNVSERT